MLGGGLKRIKAKATSPSEQCSASETDNFGSEQALIVL
jgi:hypothetical protein